MSIKNDFLSKSGTSARLIRLVALTIILGGGAAAVSQQPPAGPPLVGGFKIDYGDGVDATQADFKQPAKRDNRTADEVVRSLMKADAARGDAATSVSPSAQPNATLDLPANPPVQTPVPTLQNSVPGLPPTALPMAFPAAAPPAGPAKGPATLIQAGEMIGFSRELGDGVQAITIINASRRWMAVYHIDTSGQIRLTSSRPLDADFTIQFNATAPLPEDIRRLQGK